jgi:hypothetical protein
MPTTAKHNFQISTITFTVPSEPASSSFPKAFFCNPKPAKFYVRTEGRIINEQEKYSRKKKVTQKIVVIKKNFEERQKCRHKK